MFSVVNHLLNFNEKQNMDADLSVAYLCFCIWDSNFLLSFLLMVSSNYTTKLRNLTKIWYQKSSRL